MPGREGSGTVYANRELEPQALVRLLRKVLEHK